MSGVELGRDMGASYNGRLTTYALDRREVPPGRARGAPMKPTTPDGIRNVALISHGGAGKTSLAEAMLFDAGAIQRLGSVDAGTATLDHDPDEQKRKQSIKLAIGTLAAAGARLTIVDPHCYAEFQAPDLESTA